jgi:hypothetical protein
VLQHAVKPRPSRFVAVAIGLTFVISIDDLPLGWPRYPTDAGIDNS